MSPQRFTVEKGPRASGRDAQSWHVADNAMGEDVGAFRTRQAARRYADRLNAEQESAYRAAL